MIASRSWIIVDRRTGEAVMETFSRRIADMINLEKFEVVPVLDWLQRLNGKEKGIIDELR
jgi:hypothetical protein